jgi:NTE family protein
VDSPTSPSASPREQDQSALPISLTTTTERALVPHPGPTPVNRKPVVFDRHSGVDLADAITASCANGFGAFPHSIGDDPHRRRLPIQRECRSGSRIRAGATTRRQIADAAGLGHPSCNSGRRTTRSAAESKHSTRIATPATQCVTPMDLSTRPPSARAGYNQGKAVAVQLTEFWR